MSFTLTDEHRAIRQAVREFGKQEIQPVAREHDEQRRYPEELVEQAAELDLLAPNVPPEYGGAGMDPLESAIVTEELWRADPGIGSAIGSRGFGTNMLVEYGDEWMKEEWLPRITAGESACCSCISEPAHGSNVAGIETRAEQDGDEWVIDGTKMWITNGTVADVAIVMAKTDPGAGHRGITAFLVPTETEGFEPTKIDNKLGIHASDLGEIVLDDVRVPEENVIGEVDRGFYQLMTFFANGRVGVAAQAVGVAQAAVDAAVEYASEREQGGQLMTFFANGRVGVAAQAVGVAQAAVDAAVEYASEREQGGQLIKEYQAVSHMVAEMATKVEAARSLVYRAASLVDAGDDQLAAKYASMAKLFASERAVEVADDAIQVHGGAGFVTDHPVERYYRDARITKIYEGTSEIQKNIIADRVL